MASFTPPTTFESVGDAFWGRFKISVGLSVVKKAGHYMTTPYPWLGEIASLTEGKDWFQGGRTYEVSDAVAAALVADGFTLDVVDVGPGDDDPNAFGAGGFGEGAFGA